MILSKVPGICTRQSSFKMNKQRGREYLTGYLVEDQPIFVPDLGGQHVAAAVGSGLLFLTSHSAELTTAMAPSTTGH